jgi:hypothetical protein
VWRRINYPNAQNAFHQHSSITYTAIALLTPLQPCQQIATQVSLIMNIQPSHSSWRFWEVEGLNQICFMQSHRWATGAQSHNLCRLHGMVVTNYPHHSRDLATRQAKDFLKRPSVKRAGKLLSLSWGQLRILTGLLTGHCHLIGHLFKLDMVDDSRCGICRAMQSEMEGILVGSESVKMYRLWPKPRYKILDRY